MLNKKNTKHLIEASKDLGLLNFPVRMDCKPINKINLIPLILAITNLTLIILLINHAL